MTIFTNKWLRPLLMLLSVIYRFIIFIRNKAYDLKLKKIWKIHSKVICVGNLTVGGTGKTVIVGYLARILKNNKKKVVILSRGYKRETSGTVIVANGKRLLVSSEKAGDEPYFLARRLKTIPVVVDEDRWRGSLIAYSHFKPDYIILDDGYQHRRLHRDWNILTINAITAFDNNRLLPAGPLREPLSGIKRADFIWATQFNKANDWKTISDVIRRYTDKPFILSNYKPERLVQIPSGRVISTDSIKNKRLLIFSGIANAAGFEKTINTLEPLSLEVIEFSDHYKYKEQDYITVNDCTLKNNIDMIITTEKDFVRLPNDINFVKPLFYLEISLEIAEGEQIFWDTILS